MSKKSLEHYFPIGEAIANLLYPHAEVVVHDLQSGCIAALYNNLSKRKVGDESLIDGIENPDDIPDTFPLYFKTNWDGRRMKSITSALKDSDGKVIGLFCINLDLSQWEAIHQFLMPWLQLPHQETQPTVLFKADWREKINLFVQDFLQKEGSTLKALDTIKKQQLVKRLHKEGAFEAKNAATYIGDILGLSRATVYNYLRSRS